MRKLIKFVAAFSLLSTIGVVAQQPAQDQREVNATIDEVLKEYFATVPLTKGKHSAFYVVTAINGKDHWMILDSGADAIVLNKKIADAEGIKLTEVGNAHGVGKAAGMTYSGELESFTIGKLLKLGKAKVYFLDLKHVETIRFADGSSVPNAGQIGLGVLNSAPTSVDYKQNVLRVEKKRLKGGIAGIFKQAGYKTAKMFQSAEGRHYVEVTLKGKRAYFLVDTGAGPNLIYSEAAKEMQYKILDSKAKVSTIAGKMQKTQMTVVSEMQLGELKINGEMQMLVMPYNEKLKMINGAPLVGIMGSTMFQALNATIDFGSDTMCFPPQGK